ncbi:MAG: hypothetical protein INH34_03505 [Phycisphaerales bacterium]|nr:hypothetical protein [Phycisphaerales bacterium]
MGEHDEDAQHSVVPYCPVRCPRCAAPKPFTYGRKLRIRYHRCRDCGAGFRSLELRREQLATFDPPRR